MAETNIATQILDHIEVSGAIAEKAAKLLDANEAAAKRCGVLIPAAVDVLLKHEFILPHEKAAALTDLQDPARVLEVLINTANKVPKDHVLGKPDGDSATKEASYDSLKDNYIGRRARPSRESWKRSASILGI